MTDRNERGRTIMREVIGETYFAAREASTNPFNADARRMSEEYCFGDVWDRPGLDRRTRSLVNIGLMTAMNRDAELRAHVNGAINNGCSVEEIKEVLLQCIIYCGLPAGLHATKLAEEVLGKLGLV